MLNSSTNSPGDHSGHAVELSTLVDQFYASPKTLADFEMVASAPAPYDQLLDHNHHMTVTIEAFHRDQVDVVVHRSRSVLRNGESVWQNDPGLESKDRLSIAEQTDSYCREITLVTHTSRKVVQYGIVRLNPAMLHRQVWLGIASGRVPLGRVLIEHQVLRSVELGQLWKVTAGVSLSQHLCVKLGEIVYGRTALIRCDGKPAIELLEIVC